MINFTYETDNPTIRAKMLVEDDPNLTTLFAHFVELTRIMGYQEGSWHQLINKLDDYRFDDDYSIYDYAIDTLVSID